MTERPITVAINFANIPELRPAKNTDHFPAAPKQYSKQNFKISQTFFTSPLPPPPRHPPPKNMKKASEVLGKSCPHIQSQLWQKFLLYNHVNMTETKHNICHVLCKYFHC